jgi:hypothetical protein
MRKRIISIILSMVLVAGMLPSFTLIAWADSPPIVRMTLDGSPMSPTAIVSNETNLYAYNYNNPTIQFTQSPVGTFTGSINMVVGTTYTLNIGNSKGFSPINDRLGDFHSLVNLDPFVISNTTSFPLTLVFYSVS